jgi:hypothetical protein
MTAQRVAELRAEYDEANAELDSLWYAIKGIPHTVQIRQVYRDLVNTVEANFKAWQDAERLLW